LSLWVPRDVLKELGHARDCAKSRKKARTTGMSSRRYCFRATAKGPKSTHYRRRMSLLLLLHAIGETAKIEAKFDRQTFSDLTYYDRVVTGEERLESATINIPASLRDAAERWRVFHFHGYLTVALQSREAVGQPAAGQLGGRRNQKHQGDEAARIEGPPIGETGQPGGKRFRAFASRSAVAEQEPTRSFGEDIGGG
jgi:hypothetical protein